MSEHHPDWTEIASSYRFYAAAAPEDYADCSGDQHIWTLERLQSPIVFDRLLALWGEELKAGHTSIAGSLFSKTYARALVGAWRAVSVGNRLPDIHPSRTELWWLPGRKAALRLSNGRTEQLPDDPELRRAPRDRWIRETVEQHYRPLFEVLTFRTGLPMTTAWENAWIYLRHGYLQWMQAAEDNKLRARIRDDYETLLRDGSPFRIPAEEVPHPLRPDETVRIRQSCCLKYALPGGEHCYTCPSICGSKREEILLKKS